MTEQELTSVIERMTPIIAGVVMEEINKRTGILEGDGLTQEQYSPAQFARILEKKCGRPVTTHTICARWIKEGHLKAEKGDYSRRWSISVDEVRRVLANGGEPREITAA